MNKNTGIIIGVMALIVIVGGVYASMNSKNDAMTIKETPEQEVMEQKEIDAQNAMMQKKTVEEGAMMKKETTTDGAMMKKDTGSTAMSIKGFYGDYDSSKLANAEKGEVVLFFHAGWCPKCVTSDKNFKASATPDGLTVLKLDFDNSFELRKKYGVTMQHTFVQVDKDGNLLKKWSGSYTYDDLKTQVN
jgi:thiol-disulfide isomerase/thioredoxin